jgi:hypothetical protein
MKNICLGLFLSMFIFSCKEISFPTPQPVGIASLKEVPKALQGKYNAADDKENKDTLIVEAWGYHFKDTNDKDWLGKGSISDSLVIKMYQDYYFVNFRTGDQWILRVIKQKPNGDFTFSTIDVGDDSKRKTILKKLSKRMKVTEIKTKDDIFYQIDPTPQQLMQLIKENFFTGTELKKVANK